jgi:hypothetical protein
MRRSVDCAGQRRTRQTRRPNGRKKTYRAHDVPLTKTALGHLDRDGRDLVFDDGPRSNEQDIDRAREAGFQGSSKSKTALDEKMKKRRVFQPVSRMADLGVQTMGYPPMVQAEFYNICNPAHEARGARCS